MGAKSFKFAIEQGVSVLQVFERCRALVRSVSLGWFFMGAKSFKFAMEEGVSVLQAFERSRALMRSVSLGRVIVNWLLATMEELLLAEASKAFLESSRVGSKAFITKRFVNKLGR
jgi:hypothetical protein